MSSFKSYYGEIYESFGYPLTERTSLSAKLLAAAEKRLGMQIPAALRDYYLVAGGERRFNLCHNHLIPPQKWDIDKQRLIFMEENQCVVWWGFSTRTPGSDDPSVWQGVNDEPIKWFLEHRKCSVFLAVMLHYQAVAGGLPFCGTGSATADCLDRLQSGWSYYGQVNGMRAYSRSNQVVCFMPPGDLPFMNSMSALAGAKTKGDLQAIADDLGLALV
jgi:hypothetical protein